MANPICLSPLKFYDDIMKQNHRKSYTYNHISPLIMPFNTLLPFQFIIPNEFTIEETYLRSIDEKQVINVYDILKEYGFCNKNIENKNVVLFPGKFPIPNIKYEGEYYLEMKTNVVQEEIKTEKQILYWGVNGYTVSEDRVFLCLRGLPATYILDLNIEVVTSDGTHFACPRIPFDISSFNAEYPSSAGIFYNSANPQSEYYHGHVVDVIITNEDFQGIEIIKMDEWSSATVQNETEQIPYIHLDIESPEKQYDTTIIEYGPYTYYSDIFCFTNALEDCLEIEYWNSVGNFYLKNGVVSFDDNFHFKLLLKSEIGKPEYSFEEESTKRLGYNFIESQVSKKTYKFNTLIPEFICDAMRIIRLCDNKIIKSKGEEYEAITFEMEAEWQTQGDLASVNCEFETDNVIVNLGGFMPEELGGSFRNEHYNNDFDNQ